MVEMTDPNLQQQIMGVVDLGMLRRTGQSIYIRNYVVTACVCVRDLEQHCSGQTYDQIQIARCTPQDTEPIITVIFVGKIGAMPSNKQMY